MGYYASSYYGSGYHSSKYYQGLSITRSYSIDMGERSPVKFEDVKCSLSFDCMQPLFLDAVQELAFQRDSVIDMGQPIQLGLSVVSDFTLLNKNGIMTSKYASVKLAQKQSPTYSISKVVELEDSKEVNLNG